MSKVGCKILFAYLYSEYIQQNYFNILNCIFLQLSLVNPKIEREVYSSRAHIITLGFSPSVRVVLRVAFIPGFVMIIDL